MSASRRALQIVIAIAGVVPVGAGLGGLLLGPRFAALGGPAPANLSLDSHFRYLSGLLLGIGLMFWGSIPAIERRGPVVRALTLIVLMGGLSRAYGLLAAGPPALPMRLALIMELVVTPLVCLWQWRVERAFSPLS